MKKLLLLITFCLCAIGSAYAQIPAKHARVMELEDKMVEEAAQYFGRRYPGEPFLVKVDVTPLRRTPEKNGKNEELPYFEFESEESIDEWDDMNIPVSYLRSRVVKIMIDIAVPTNFDEQKINEIRHELTTYLRLIPSRDDIRVEKRFEVKGSDTPNYAYLVTMGILVSALVLGGMIRWSASKIKTQTSSPAATSGSSSSYSAQAPVASPATKRRGSTEVSGDVTFHDPIKTLDIVHIKLKQISDSGTFPNLRDMISMYELCRKSPEKLGAIIYELPQEWQKLILSMGKDTDWLLAFSSPGRIDQTGLELLESMSRTREFSGAERNLENLLIQIWRMDDKAVGFFKKMEQEHAFILLSLLPKSVSLRLAKKAYPGNWGKLLENRMENVVLDSKLVKDYMRIASEIVPPYDQKILMSFKKDKEILSYLNLASIEEERDIYETLSPESFILKVRAPFYKTFELESSKLLELIQKYPLDKWALVVMNSNRSYSKQIVELLDDKKRLIFSNHLKRMDQNVNPEEQSEWRQIIAADAEEFLKSVVATETLNVENPAMDDANEKIA